MNVKTTGGDMVEHLSGKEILDLLATGECSAEQRAHLDACPECCVRWAEFEKTWRLLGYWDAESVAPDLVERVVQTVTYKQRQTAWRVRSAMISQAAAIILLATGAGFVAGHLSRVPEGPAVPSIHRSFTSVDAERAHALGPVRDGTAGLGESARLGTVGAKIMKRAYFIIVALAIGAGVGAFFLGRVASAPASAEPSPAGAPASVATCCKDPSLCKWLRLTSQQCKRVRQADPNFATRYR